MGLFPPTDDRVVNTINVLSDLFNDIFPINEYDDLKGYGGILFGRYEGNFFIFLFLFFFYFRFLFCNT